jgi:hypothetical protein
MINAYVLSVILLYHPTLAALRRYTVDGAKYKDFAIQE